METSPTGTPVLPAWAPKVAVALVLLANAVKAVLPPHPTVAGSVCDAIIGLGAALGIASQGVRKAPAEDGK